MSGSGPGGPIGSKVILAPKLNGGLSSMMTGGGGLGSSPGIGSSSILNLPVLGGQDGVVLQTNRGLKGIDSSKQLLRNEENKISSTASFDMNLQNKNPGGYFSRPANVNDPLSPNSPKDKKPLIAQTSRNTNVLNNKLSSHRFLSPLSTNDNAGKSNQAAAAATNLIPPSGIDKYPGA